MTAAAAGGAEEEDAAATTAVAAAAVLSALIVHVQEKSPPCTGTRGAVWREGGKICKTLIPMFF